MKKSVLTAVIKTKNADKFQLEVSQIRENPAARTNLAALLNADDEKFSQSQPKARKAWLTASSAMIKQYFGIDVNEVEFTEVNGKMRHECNIEAPSIDGQMLCVQLNDSLKKNYNNRPKRSTRKVNGESVVEIFTLGSKPIYQETSVVLQKDLKDTILVRDGVMSEAEFAEYSVDNAIEEHADLADRG